MLRDREELVRRLKAKPVHKAVRWYDPDVLVRVGIRDAISAVFGEYADQRLMQAATDGVGRDKLAGRYNYSAENSIPSHAGAYWVDYIADVGDGFGPTYGMAWLLAQKQLSLHNYHGESLPAGHILVLGGDQCYPQATHEEYEERFVLPYASALLPCEREHERKLFALPGNHDWYDGLGAFDNLFCQNRDPLLERNGRRIGGWRCVQHRSYWAIQLPHKWWLWGVDIQFSKYLDAAQENYFRTIVDQMEGDNNIVLCIAEPHWLDSEFEGIDTVDTLHTIVRIAQKRTNNESEGEARNVRIRAVLAGDWHHYSHYLLDDLYDPERKEKKGPLQRLQTRLKPSEGQPALEKQGIHLITAGGGGAFLHSTTDLRKKVNVSWGVRPENISEPEASKPAVTMPGHEREEDRKQLRPRPRRFTGIAEMQACYPSRFRSAFLTLKNLTFPVRNWRFSLVIGALYWVMTWAYHLVVKTAGDPPLKRKINTVSYETINSVSNLMLSSLPDVAAESIFYCLLLFGLWAGLVWYVSVSEKRTPLFKWVVRGAVGSLHALAHLKAMFMLFLLCVAFNNAAFYPVLIIPLGGLVGGFIFGAYWVLTGLLARMHTGDAFGALGIRDYKNFVRMKFERDKLTIYPIGVKKLPSTKSLTKACRKLDERAPPKGSSQEREPLLKIDRLEGILIPNVRGEVKPIVITADTVETHGRHGRDDARIKDAAE